MPSHFIEGNQILMQMLGIIKDPMFCTVFLFVRPNFESQILTHETGRNLTQKVMVRSSLEVREFRGRCWKHSSERARVIGVCDLCSKN